MKRTFTTLTSKAALSVTTLFFLSGCASTPPAAQEIDPMARENAIFQCKREVQDAKKARFKRLPATIKRIMGDNQVLGEFDKIPTRAQINRAIGKFPLAGDSGGAWGSEKEAHLRTISTRIEKFAPTENDPEGTEFLSMSVGQPGRIYPMPLAKLNSYSFGTLYQGGLLGKTEFDQLQIRIIDEHHVLVIATADRKKGSESRFHLRDLYAVVRTYVEQSYDEETATQLPDYPVYGPGFNEDDCEQKTGAAAGPAN